VNNVFFFFLKKKKIFLFFKIKKKKKMNDVAKILEICNPVTHILELYILEFCHSLSHDTMYLILQYLSIVDYSISIRFITKVFFSNKPPEYTSFWFKLCHTLSNPSSVLQFTPATSLPFLYFVKRLTGFSFIQTCTIQIGLDILGPSTGYMSQPLRACLNPAFLSCTINREDLDWSDWDRRVSGDFSRKRKKCHKKIAKVHVYPGVELELLKNLSCNPLDCKPYVNAVIISASIWTSLLPR
jgi:hypothetical protein